MGDILDSGDDMNLVQAFEVFSGKLYFPQSSSTSSSYSSNPATSTKETFTGIVETPLQRLARLRMELSELETDFANMSSKESAEVDQKNITNAMEDISLRLSAISNNTNHGTTSPKSVQTNLTQVVSTEMEKLRELKQKSKNDDETTPSAGTSITYELYAGAAASDVESESRLEDRMAQIEAMLGVTSTSSSLSTGSVLDRLHEVEKMAKSVDLSSLDSAAARAKLIRTDLEAGAKHRSKLPLPPEDSKTIALLHDQMTSLSQLSSELPIVISRLTDLAHLHTHASDFATRLVEVETNTQTMERMLVHFEDILNQVEKGCVENVSIVEQNMMVLDQKMDALRT